MNGSFCSGPDPLAVFLRLASAVLAGSIFLFAGCTSLSVERDHSEIMARLPQPQLVSLGHAWEAACLAASHEPGGQVFCGAGNSMQPLYADGTTIVVGHYDYAKLQPGMAVVYWSHRGNRVCHVIVGQSFRGYIMQGLNNNRWDEEYVTQKNYIGVVTQAFASLNSRTQPVLASTIASSSRLGAN
jgi:hypothetical protein